MRKNGMIKEILLFGVTGILLSLSVAAMYCSGKWNLDKFYDVGETYEYRVDSSASVVSFVIPAWENEWKYLYVYTANISAPPLLVKFSWYDKAGNILKEENRELVNGENVITLEELDCKRVAIVPDDSNRTSYNFYKAQLREEEKYFSGRQFICVSFICLVLYGLTVAGLCGIFRKYRKGKRWRINLAKSIQRTYGKIFENIAVKVARVPERTCSLYRVECLTLLFFYSILTTKFGEYLEDAQYKLYIVVELLFLGIWTCMNLKPKTKIYSPGNIFVKAWGSMCLMMCISDFIVYKKFAYTGIWMLLVFGLVYWGWSIADKPVLLLREMEKAVEIVFFLFCIYCILFEHYQENHCYSGMTRNPNTLGEFMVIVMAMIFSKLDGLFFCKGKRKSILVAVVELALAVYLMKISGCRAAQVVGVICVLLFLAKIWMNRKRSQYRKNVCVFFLSLVIAGVPAVWGFHWGISNVPSMIIDEYQPQVPVVATDNQGIIPVLVTESIDVQENVDQEMKRVIWYNRIDDWLTGRLSIWRKYLEHMNLWGHYGDQAVDGKVGGKKIGAHNVFVTLAYRYGIFILIPYGAMVGYMVCYGVRYMVRQGRKWDAHALLPLSITLCYLLCGIIDNIEQPLRYVPWIVFYVIIGFYIVYDVDREKIENEGNAEAEE